MGADMDKGGFLIKPNIGGLFLLGKPCSHKLSFLRLCYALGAFFGCFFRLLTVLQAVGKYHFEQLVAECFCAAVIEKQFRNDGLSVPLCRDDTVGGLFCHRRHTRSRVKRDFPQPGKSLLVVGILFYCAGAAAACAFLLARYSRALIRS